MIPFKYGSRYSRFLRVLLFILKHGIWQSSASAYARNIASSSIFCISSGITASLRPPVQVRFSTFIRIFSRIICSSTPLTRTPSTPIYGLFSVSFCSNAFKNSDLSNFFPEYCSYASFNRQIEAANFTFSHSSSSCGISSI